MPWGLGGGNTTVFPYFSEFHKICHINTFIKSGIRQELHSLLTDHVGMNWGYVGSVCFCLVL